MKPKNIGLVTGSTYEVQRALGTVVGVTVVAVWWSLAPCWLLFPFTIFDLVGGGC